jgi:hypothetical protein
VAGTQSTAIENAINGSAKAWVNFNGTGTVAIRQGYNVSSLTDVRAGVYYVNFTNNMVDTNYAGVSTSSTVNNNNANNPIYQRDVNRVGIAHYESNAETDTPDMYVAIFR